MRFSERFLIPPKDSTCDHVDLITIEPLGSLEELCEALVPCQSQAVMVWDLMDDPECGMFLCIEHYQKYAENQDDWSEIIIIKD